MEALLAKLGAALLSLLPQAVQERIRAKRQRDLDLVERERREVVEREAARQRERGES